MPVKSTYLELVSDITVKLTDIAWSLSEKKDQNTLCPVFAVLHAYEYPLQGLLLV